MSGQFAEGRLALGVCDSCGFQFKLRELRNLVVKRKLTGTKVCRWCWVPDHPQLHLDKVNVRDPQALRDPRPDNTYSVSGVHVDGSVGMGSRVTQWSWNPVGGAQLFGSLMIPDDLIVTFEIGSVTVVTT